MYTFSKAENLSHFKKAIKSELKTLKKESKKNDKQRSRYLSIVCLNPIIPGPSRYQEYTEQRFQSPNLTASLEDVTRLRSNNAFTE